MGDRGVKIANVAQRLERVDSLHAHPRNPNQGDVGQISESIEAHGFYGQVIAQQSSRTILAGAHRWLAAQALGMDKIPVTWIDVDDEQALRIVLVDNRSSESAYRDPAGLVELLEELARTPIGLAGTGYDGDALDELLTDLRGPFQPVNPDEVTEPPAIPVTRPGDLWELGEHRLLCGDARNDLGPLMEQDAAAMVLADPPYGVAYTGGSGNERPRPDSYADRFVDYRAWLAAVLAAGHEASDEHAALHLWFGTSRLREVLGALDDSGWEDRAFIVWNKLNAHYGALGAQYKLRFEPLFYCHKKGRTPRWEGPTNEPTVWDFDQPSVNELHPTMKPVPLYERSILNHTQRGDLVLELFGGSGTTLIACEQQGRAARLIEIDPGYCDVIARRFQNLTGTKPIRDGAPVDFLA